MPISTLHSIVTTRGIPVFTIIPEQAAHRDRIDPEDKSIPPKNTTMDTPIVQIPLMATWENISCILLGELKLSEITAKTIETTMINIKIINS